MSAVLVGLPLRLKGCLILICIVLSALCSAQGRWQLGNPSLIIDMPADPSSGGVAWHDRGFAVLPTSWSAESADLRVEVAESYSTDSAQALAAAVATKLGGSVQSGREVQISGFQGYRFQVGPRQGLSVSASGRGWIVVLSPKTSAGMSAVEPTFSSIVLERWGTPRWVRRSFGSTKMNAELPYEMAAEAAGSSNTVQDFELHFDDFSVEAWISSASEGKTIDYEGTIRSYVEGEKSRPGTADFKSSREKVKRDKVQGDVVTIEMKRGAKSYKIRSFFGMEQGRLLRISAVARPDRADHETFSQRIISSLQVSSVDFANFAPRRIPGEDVWFDLAKEFDPPKETGGSKTTGVFGGFALDVRITMTAPGLKNDGVQLIEMLEGKHRGRVPTDAKDIRVDNVSRIVDGIQTRTMKLRYKGKGRADDTVVYAMALMLPDRIVVAEMIAEDQQSAYLDRIVDTAKIELAPPPGWTRWAIGEMGMSVLFGKRPESEKLNPGAGQSSVTDYAMDHEGVIALAQEVKYAGETPIAGILLRNRFEEMKRAFGVTGRIVSQQPVEFAKGSGIRALIEMDHARGTVEVDLIVLRRGNSSWSVLAFSEPHAAAKRAAFINSIR